MCLAVKILALTVLIGAMPSEPDRLSGAEPGVDPEPPSELLEGPATSATALPLLPLSTDLRTIILSQNLLTRFPLTLQQ